jgi:Spy/CpxP family protein refolding chaperone
MKRWKLLAGIILVFILGLVVGSMGTYVLFGHGFRHFEHKDPAARNVEILEHFRKQLSLTDQQATRVKAIIEQMEIKRMEYFRKSREDLKQILESGFALIRQELTPEQQKQFDAFRAKMEKDRKERDPSH